MRWLAVGLLLALLGAGCSLPPPSPVPTPTPTPTTPEPVPEVRFEGDRAYALVREQVLDATGATRYRVPGTPGNAEVARWIDAGLRNEGLTVHWHHFNATYGCEEVAMHNVVGELAGTSGRVVVFGAHYDTRPIADKDPDRARRDDPIPGAIDGASGVAVLMELARVLPPTDATVRFVFFDGEDGGGYKGGRCTDWILGSSAYAASLTDAEVAAIDAFVLVDMVGGADLLIPREGNTAADPRSRALQDEIFAAARALGHDEFVDRVSYAITDDHVPFLERGIPSVDLIHLLPDDRSVFPAWHHTHADDLDAVDVESLEAVGETLELWLARRG